MANLNAQLMIVDLQYISKNQYFYAHMNGERLRFQITDILDEVSNCYIYKFTRKTIIMTSTAVSVMT